MDDRKELFTYCYGLVCLATVFFVEARYIYQFATGDITIDPKQFDLLLFTFSAATIIGGIIAWHYEYLDLSCILLLIGVLETMFAYIEYVEGSILTITFIDYVYTGVMVVATAILIMSKKYGMGALTILSALMFFSFKVSDFGVDGTTGNWAVTIFGTLAGLWCLALVLLKYLDIEGKFCCGLFGSAAEPKKSE